MYFALENMHIGGPGMKYYGLTVSPHNLYVVILPCGVVALGCGPLGGDDAMMVYVPGFCPFL